MQRVARQLVKVNRRNFSVDHAGLQSALASGNFSATAAQVSAADIKSATCSKWMASYVSLLTRAENTEQYEASEASAAVDEYFRGQFRKMNTQ